MRSRAFPASAAVTLVAVAVAVLAACEVPAPRDDTGGLGGGDGEVDVCDRGISVISSDFQSTAIAFVDWKGGVISPRVLTSGSTDAALSAPLSGDVVAPTTATSQKEAVVLDRGAASVLTWIDLATGKPRGQLSVRTGFAANPQDYVQVSERLGFVSRLDDNRTPGREPFDGGSDLLVIDPRVPAIVDRIALAEALVGADAGLLPRPTRLIATGGRVLALLGMLSADFQSTGDARLAVIDAASREIEETVRIDGLENCQAMALSPATDRVAVGCTGKVELDGTTDISRAGIAVVTLGAGGAASAVSGRFPATSFGRSPQFSIAFASEQTVLFPTFGTDPAEGGTAHGDELVELDLTTGASRVLLTSADAFDLGEVRCAADCGSCFLADAGEGSVRRFTVDGGAASEAGPVRIDDGIGLPPRFIGAL